jgi:hypothetical protein
MNEIAIHQDCWVTSINGVRLDAPMWCKAGTVLKVEPRVETTDTAARPGRSIVEMEWYEP